MVEQNHDSRAHKSLHLDQQVGKEGTLGMVLWACVRLTVRQSVSHASGSLLLFWL